MLLIELSAEREGFEPPVPCGTSVFKTDVIDHSTISPCCGGSKYLAGLNVPMETSYYSHKALLDGGADA